MGPFSAVDAGKVTLGATQERVGAAPRVSDVRFRSTGPMPSTPPQFLPPPPSWSQLPPPPPSPPSSSTGSNVGAWLFLVLLGAFLLPVLVVVGFLALMSASYTGC